MKSTFILAFVTLIGLKSIGQTKQSIFLESAAINYSRTDFTKIDAVDQWFYLLTIMGSSKRKPGDKIAQLIFQRKEPVDDTLSLQVFNRKWLPNISFEVFGIADSTYCFGISEKIRLISSCVPPDLGGDIILIGNYVLLNRTSCVDCARYDTKQDYCRPVINKLLLDLDKSKIGTLEELVNQFPIKGEILKVPF
jgi:hypothetical protein